MKCPSCGFVSFDDLDTCKRCGFDLDAVRRGEKPASPSVFKRLRRKQPAQPSAGQKADRQALAGLNKSQELTRREVDLHKSRRHGEDDFLSQERKIREERARLKDAYQKASSAEQEYIRSQLDMLDRERRRLRRASEDFEKRQRAMERKLQEEIEGERKTAREEIKRMREAEEKISRTLAEDRERFAKTQAELKLQAEQAKKEAEQAREEAKKAREEAQTVIHLARRKASEETRKLMDHISRRSATVKKVEAEVTAEDGLATGEENAVREEEVDVSLEREQWRQAVAKGKKPDAADYIRFLSRREKGKKAAPPKIDEPPAIHRKKKEPEGEVVLEEVEVGFPDEEIIEEIEHEDESHFAGRVETHPEVVPKGGLIRRTLAGLIDFALLLFILGLFLVISRLITSNLETSAADLLQALGVPFYILFILLTTVYVTYMHAVYGQTLGKRLLRLRVLTTHGEDLGYVNAFFRFVATCFAIGLLGMGVVWIMLDPNKQGWHDKISRTVVVRI